MTDTTSDFTVSTRAELEAAIANIATLEASVQARQAKMDAAAAKIIRPFIEALNPLKAELAALSAEVSRFCLENQPALLAGAGKKKSVLLATGTVQFKTAKMRVVCDDEDAAVAALAAAGYPDAIRTKQMLDKNYLLQHSSICEVVGEVRVEGGEETVVIKPLSIT